MGITAFNTLSAKSQGVQVRYLSGVINLLLAAVLGYMLAKLVLAMLPTPPQNALTVTASASSQKTTRPADPGVVIASKHLFGEAGKKPVVAPTPTKEAPETRLNLKLSGVLAFQPPESAMAIIGSGSQEKVYAIGDAIIGAAKLVEVHPDRVIIDQRGRRETLRLPEKTAPINLGRPRAVQNTPTAHNLPNSPKALRDKILKNPRMLADLVTVRPYQENGKLRGFRLSPKQGAEILQSQGIMANDVITQVNGVQLNSQSQGLKALRKLSKARSIDLTVLRGGAEIPISISLE